jgi:hypothetical protein
VGVQQQRVNWLADILTVRYGADLRKSSEPRAGRHRRPSTEFSWRQNDYDPL